MEGKGGERRGKGGRKEGIEGKGGEKRRKEREKERERGERN